MVNFRNDIPKTVDVSLLKNPDDVLKSKLYSNSLGYFSSFIKFGYFIGR